MIDFTEGSNDEITINEAAADLDVRIEGEDDANLLFTDASTPGRVGIGTNSPGAKLDVKGDMSISGSIIPEGSGSFDLGSNTNPYKEIHVMSSSIHFYDNNGEIGKLSYIKNEGLRIIDKSSAGVGLSSVIDGGSF